MGDFMVCELDISKDAKIRGLPRKQIVLKYTTEGLWGHGSVVESLPSKCKAEFNPQNHKNK
jgi:hypothetical protein